jgi:hypothetical protein
MLDEFIAVNRSEIVGQCRATLATRSVLAPASLELDHGVPAFLDQLLTELRRGPSPDFDIAKTAMQHGHDLQVQRYTVSQAVHDYGDVCQAVTALAVERQAAISTEDFRTLNGCLDNAIASAVAEYGRARDRSSKQNDTREGPPPGAVASDLLKSIQISKVAFDAVRSGKSGVTGRTGTVLSLGLDAAHDLAERLITSVRGVAS